MEKEEILTNMNKYLNRNEFKGKYVFIPEKYNFDIELSHTRICILYDNVKRIRLNSSGDISISCKGFEMLLWWCTANIHIMALL